MKNNKTKKLSRGATIVEFSIIGLLFLAIVFAAIEFGIYAFEKIRTEESLETSLKKIEGMLGEVLGDLETSITPVEYKGATTFDLDIPCDNLVNMTNQELKDTCEEKVVFCFLYQVAQKSSANMNNSLHPKYVYGSGNGKNCGSSIGIILPGFKFENNKFIYEGEGGGARRWGEYAKNIYPNKKISVESRILSNKFFILKKIFGFEFGTLSHFGIARSQSPREENTTKKISASTNKKASATKANEKSNDNKEKAKNSNKEKN